MVFLFPSLICLAPNIGKCSHNRLATLQKEKVSLSREASACGSLEHFTTLITCQTHAVASKVDTVVEITNPVASINTSSKICLGR
jgi:hypothetical protein